MSIVVLLDVCEHVYLFMDCPNLWWYLLVKNLPTWILLGQIVSAIGRIF